MKKLITLILFPLSIGVMSVHADEKQANPAQIAAAQLEQTVRKQLEQAQQAAMPLKQAPNLPEGFMLAPKCAVESACYLGGCKMVEEELAFGYFGIKYDLALGTMAIVPPDGYPTVTLPLAKKFPVTKMVKAELSGSDITSADVQKAPTAILVLVRADGSDKTVDGVIRACDMGLFARTSENFGAQKDIILKRLDQPDFLIAAMWIVRANVFEHYKVFVASEPR